ncbi:MAG TPA: hypothetical protein DCX01_01290 [Bacteroidetes bacterium]|nr:hypothetical protein [Bacteroidota bacterium]
MLEPQKSLKKAKYAYEESICLKIKSNEIKAIVMQILGVLVRLHKINPKALFNLVLSNYAKFNDSALG